MLAAVQSFMPRLGLQRERIVFVSGIGCAARFPYMETYGMRSIHGRAPAIATSLAVSRPDLSVWVVTGDGDALYRQEPPHPRAAPQHRDQDPDVQQRGLRADEGPVRRRHRAGSCPARRHCSSIDAPFNPLSLALGADATFVARAIDTDPEHLTEVLRRAAERKGTAFVEVLQNCNIYNDGVRRRARREVEPDLPGARRADPLRRGGERGAVEHEDGSVFVAPVAEVSEDALLVHDEHAAEPSARSRSRD